MRGLRGGTPTPIREATIEMRALFQHSYIAAKPLFSFHIPKCGGQSLAAVLRFWFKDRFHAYYYDEITGDLPVVPIPHGGSVTHGHFSDEMAIHLSYPDASQSISFIRDPFEIAVSNYFYLKNASSHWRVKPNIPTSLEAYLEQAVTDRFDLVFNFLPERAVGLSIEEFIRSTFLFVGLLEDYQASVDWLAELLHKPRVHVPFINTSNRDEDVPDLRGAFRSIYTEEYQFFDLIRDAHGQRRTSVASGHHSAERGRVIDHP